MQNFFQKNWPHFVAIAIFLLVSVVFCKPALEGKVLQQGDITHWKGMNKDIEDYRVTHDGKAALWTDNLFSGMPGFQISTNNNNLFPYVVHQVFSLYLPKPLNFFFLACIGFYFLGIVLRLNPWVSMLGAISYAYASYDPIIVAVGHETKMLSIAYLPALLGSVLLILEGRTWIGTALTALFTAILINHNHYQVTYYFILMAAFLGIAWLIHIFRSGSVNKLFAAVPALIIAAVVGVASNAMMMLTTYDYSKETIRGGKAAVNLSDTAIAAQNAKGGLDTGYAFRWSYGKAESYTFLIPNIYGGVSKGFDENSKLYETVSEKGLPQQFAQAVMQSLPEYWGQQPGTSGPVYLGAIICFLFIFGLFYIKSWHKWWIAAVTVLALLMSWGKNLPAFNNFLFEYLPLYNKFRAPSMILIIPQLTFPMLGMMALQQALFTTKDRAGIWPDLKKSFIATAVVFGVAVVLYFSFDYKIGFESLFQQQITQAANGDTTLGKDIIQSVIDSRKDLFRADLLRSLFFVLVAAGALFLFVKNKISALWTVILLLVFGSIDVIGVGKRYLNNENFLEPEENENVFTLTAADQQILTDQSPHYRVLNLTQDVFNDAITSYHHRSVGGYHPAKLSIYQDLIENHLAGQNVNISVLNMLDTKYIIQQDPQSGQPMAQVNPNALGAAWFVRDVVFVKDAREEMNALKEFNPKDTAFVQESFKSSVASYQWDSAGSIQLIKTDNDFIQYKSKSSSPQFGVFSEIYYSRGWKAFIDGKETPIVKTNYVLRGLSVPAGEHTIEFKFEPESYLLGRKITGFCQFFLPLMLLGGIFMEWRNRKKKPDTNYQA